MKLLSKLGVLSLLACGTVPFGCSSDTVLSGKPDGSAVEDAGGITCGSKYCPPSRGIGIEKVAPCCLDSGDCGLKFPTANKCLPPDQPGIPSVECGDYAVPNQNLTLTGCCGPNGCGKNDAFLGCVVNTDLDLEAKACNYDPTNTCLSLDDIPCDGPEDCPGQRCCAQISINGVISEAACYDSCEALASGGAPWREFCHPGGACENSTFQCRTVALGSFPSSVLRCANARGDIATGNFDDSADHVNCGTGVCGAGEKCCIAVNAMGTENDYCIGKSEACKCKAPAGSTKPGPRSDAGSQPVPTDAGSKD